MPGQSVGPHYIKARGAGHRRPAPLEASSCSEQDRGIVVARHQKKIQENQHLHLDPPAVSPYCFGIKTRAGKPAHCNPNADVLGHFAALCSGYRDRHLSRLNNADMADHFAGKKTFYFTADGRCRVLTEVLVNIDIDCHRSGSLAGAIAFAEHLRATRFPNLYFEASTNGNGAHGYLVVVKGDLGDEGLNSVLGETDRRLKAELARGDWDVEAVEVKGQAPVFGWGAREVRAADLPVGPAGQAAARGTRTGRRAEGHHPGDHGRTAWPPGRGCGPQLSPIVATHGNVVLEVASTTATTVTPGEKTTGAR